MSKVRKYFERELSWLEFDKRVLAEATDQEIPLLERLKFLAISSNNLDEFFMVRIGSLKLLQSEGILDTPGSYYSTNELLEKLSSKIRAFNEAQDLCFNEDILPGLKEVGIIQKSFEQLDPIQADHLQRVFFQEVFPLVSPIMVPEGKFPLLTNFKMYLALRLAPEEEGDTEELALLPLEQSLDRFILLPCTKGYEFILLEDFLEAFASEYFPRREIIEVAPFRISRNADMSVQEDLASDLLKEMEQILHMRRISGCVRLELQKDASPEVTALLQEGLELSEQDIYFTEGSLNYAEYFSLGMIDGYAESKYTPWISQESPLIDPARAMFQNIAEGDILLHHPYHKFDSILRFIKEAAEDPAVLAIKQTLYRTSKNSPVVAALQRAAELGKTVTVVVELKARFDEAQNIEWARKLEEAGVQVIYGVRGLKTHSKILVVVRKEQGGIKRYMHFGTGNYNENTAKIYGDISLLTCNETLGQDASAFFNAICGYSQSQTLKKLSMAPIGIKDQLLEMIELEVELKRQGQDAKIMAKLNSLSEPDIINALYKASKAGVDIELNIRGICTLRPGVKDLSENIRVVSIVDRYLEHSRIIYFNHGGSPKVYISSADWMPRNLNRRIELMIPVEDAVHIESLTQFLECYFNDNAKAWELQEDGTYVRIREHSKAAKLMQSQHELQLRAEKEIQIFKQSQNILFEPYRSEDVS